MRSLSLKILWIQRSHKQLWTFIEETEQVVNSINALFSGDIPTGILKCWQSVWFKCSVMSSSLWPHGLQHTPWTDPMASLSITNSQSLLKLMYIKLVVLSNHLILCHPLLLLPLIFLSIRVFSNQLVLHIRWPKYWSFSFSISPSSENSGLISFRID